MACSCFARFAAGWPFCLRTSGLLGRGIISGHKKIEYEYWTTGGTLATPLDSAIMPRQSVIFRLCLRKSRAFITAFSERDSAIPANVANVLGALPGRTAKRQQGSRSEWVLPSAPLVLSIKPYFSGHLQLLSTNIYKQFPLAQPCL